MGWHYPSPFRLARGRAVVAALAANFSTVSLFHNGDPRFLLVVRDINMTAATNSAFVTGVAQGSIGSLVMAGIPVVTGEPTPPGQIFSSQQTALPSTPDYNFGTNNAYGVPWLHDYAFVALRPGFSFWISGSVVLEALTAAILWEFVYAANVMPPDDENEALLEAGQ